MPTTTALGTSQASVVYGTPVTFTATVSASIGAIAPAAGSVDFYDTTTKTDLGLGAFSGSTGTISTWTLATGVKTFNVTTADTITASYLPGTGFAGSSGTTSEAVTALPITVSAVGNSKIYDGTTSAAATPTISPALVGSDTANFTESYATKNAGSGLTLAPAGSITDGNNGSNSSITLAPLATGAISARAITVTAAANSKIYDGSTSAAALPTISAGTLVSGDTAAFSESYGTKNVGIGITLTAAGSVIDGNSGNNYVVTFAANMTGQITPRAISVAATTSTKIYDGTTSTATTPTIAAGSLANGDAAAFVETFDTTNVGTSATLTAAGSVNDGNSGGNYSVSLVNDTTGVINKANAAIQVTPYIVTYDGSSQMGTGTATGVLGESLSGLNLSGTAHTNAGIYEGDGWTFTDVTGNYVSVSGTVNDEIDQALPTVSVAPMNTIYDGLTQRTEGEVYGVGGVDLGPASISYSTLDTLTPVNAGSYTATGSYSGSINYLPATATAAISIGQATATIQVTPYNATYDGSTQTATGSATGVLGESLSGLSLSGTAHTNAGTYNGDGWTFTDATGNYVNASGTVNDSIGQAGLTITAATNTKTYDGTTVAGAMPTVNGLQGGDSVSGLVETCSDVNAGTGKTLYATDYTVNDSNGGSNYLVTFVANTTGEIVARAITVTAASSTKTYDGSTSTTATPTITAGGLVAGDTVAFTEAFETKNAGTGETLTAAGSVNDGNDGSNYAVTFAADTTGQITARAITVTAATNTKNYDGTVSAAVKPTITTGSLAAGDAAAFNESYDNPNAGTGKTLTPAGSVSDGNGGSDYAVTFVVNTTGAINAATAAKLMLTETSSSTVVSAHDVVYTITLKNLGPGAAQNVVISDNLAASGLTYVSDPVPASCTASTPAVGCTGMVTFTVPSLAPGVSATFTLVAGVGTTTTSNTSVSNKVSVCCATPLTSSSVTAASVQAKVNAAGASLVGSSLDTGQTDLVVTGTAGSDAIYVLPAAGNQLLVLDNGRALGPFAAPTGRIVVYGGNGNDMVYISPLLTESSWIFGGAGNNVFYADSGNSVLVGGSGNNLLMSGRGDNLLIGGCGGRTTILGTQGNNVEIGGSVNYEANEAALAAILAEWSSGDSYAVRVGRLDGTIGGGLNGSWVLNASTIDHGPGHDAAEGCYRHQSQPPRRSGAYMLGHPARPPRAPGALARPLLRDLGF